MLRSFATGILIGAAALFVSAPNLRAEDAKAVLQSLYGGRMKQVAATADRADDVALAREMIGVAKTSGSTPELQALLCEAAYELGAKHPDGYGAAAEAMAALAEAQEPKRTAAREKWIDILGKQSRAGKQEQRDAASDALIELLVTLGDEKAEKKQYSEAAADFRRALATAQLRKSESIEDIKARMEGATGRDRAVKQLERLQAKLLVDANDFATAEEIVKLYVVEFDDPKAASQYLNRVKDEQLKKCLPVALKAIGELQAIESLDLAEWYRTLADHASAPFKPAMVLRGKACIERFLAAHDSKDDLAARKGEVLAKQLEQMAPASPVRPTASRVETPQGNRDIMSVWDSVSTAKMTNLDKSYDWKTERWLHRDKELKSILHHPPLAEGHGDAAFEVELPKVSSGQAIVLRFGTLITAATEDGVKYSVLINDKSIWTRHEKSGDRLEYFEFPLTKLGGKRVKLTLRVERVGNNSFDHSRWIDPMISVISADEKKPR